MTRRYDSGTSGREFVLAGCVEGRHFVYKRDVIGMEKGVDYFVEEILMVMMELVDLCLG